MLQPHVGYSTEQNAVLPSWQPTTLRVHGVPRSQPPTLRVHGVLPVPSAQQGLQLIHTLKDPTWTRWRWGGGGAEFGLWHACDRTRRLPVV